MKAALDTMATYALALLISLGLAWCIDRWVFGFNAPGLFQ